MPLAMLPHLRGVLDLRRRTGERECEPGERDRSAGVSERDRGTGERAAGEADRSLLAERPRGDVSLPFACGDADMLPNKGGAALPSD